MSKNKHLSLDDRCTIQISLSQQLSFKAIGRILEKNCSTISKEVRNHLIFEKKGAPYRPFNDCTLRKSCSHYGSACSICTSKRRNPKCSLCGRCSSECPDYEKEDCELLLKPPYVCNGCQNRNLCTLEKRIYDAHKAHAEYTAVLSESRSGFNLTEDELKQLNSVISPLLMNGQSLHHILVNNQDTVSCCEKTAYIYADKGLFDAGNIDMPRKVRFRPRRRKSVPLKVDKSCRNGRHYTDFLQFHENNPSLHVVQADTVEGLKGKPVLLTLHFVLPRLQLAFIRQANDSRSVTNIFNCLYELLGSSLFCKLFPVILADNGTEFSNPAGMENAPDGTIRSHLFYCDPSSPAQKGACENNHEFIRRIIPKGIDIGQYSQAQINLMMDHINSYGRPELGDKSPYDMFEFYYGREALDLLNIHRIPANEIILKPLLLKKSNSL